MQFYMENVFYSWSFVFFYQHLVGDQDGTMPKANTDDYTRGKQAPSSDVVEQVIQMTDSWCFHFIKFGSSKFQPYSEKLRFLRYVHQVKMQYISMNVDGEFVQLSLVFEILLLV